MVGWISASHTSTDPFGRLSADGLQKGLRSLEFQLLVMTFRRLEFQDDLPLLGMAHSIILIFLRLYFGKRVAGGSIFLGGR